MDARTEDQWTPLHCAARWNQVEAAQLLLQAGADPNATTQGGLTPLLLAANQVRRTAFAKGFFWVTSAQKNFTPASRSARPCARCCWCSPTFGWR